MASQPANTTISVNRRVRSYRQNLRHNSVKSLTGRMRQQIMSVVGEETLHLTTYDGDDGITQTSLNDAEGIGVAAGDTNRKGLPVVVGFRPLRTLSDAIGTGAFGGNGMSNIKFFTIGENVFIESVEGSEGQDIQADLRDNVPTTDAE